MISSFILFGMIAAPHSASQIVVESAESRKLLPNGSAVWVESRKANYTSVQLILSQKGIDEDSRSFGYRHLIEHIIARSIPGHDEQVESIGGFLNAATERDYVRFEWHLPPGHVTLAIQAIEKFLKFSGFSESAIQQESTIIGHETRLQDPMLDWVDQNWSLVYGESGIGPMGDLENCRTATPLALRLIWKQLTTAHRVVIAVSGPEDPNAVMVQATQLLSKLPLEKPPTWRLRSAMDQADQLKPPFDELELVLPCGPVSQKKTLARLVAAFGIASRFERPVLVYQPTARDGLILIRELSPSNPGKNSIGKKLASEDPAALFYVGKRNLKSWILSQTRTPNESAKWNGVLLSLDPGLRSSKLIEEVDQAPYTEFLQVFRRYQEVSQ